MNKKKLFIFFLVCFLFNGKVLSENIKECEFCGTFYPTGAKLTTLLDGFLSVSQSYSGDGEIIGGIAPHAGYIYSGQIAARTYKNLEGTRAKTIILLAPSHKYFFNGIAIYPNGEFQTPLGNLFVNTDIARGIASLNFVNTNLKYFDKEHSIEVQLPFIKKVLNDVTIVPVLFGEVTLNELKMLGVYLAKLSKTENFEVIVSTDLSHYHPYNDARVYDYSTIKLIEAKDTDELWRTRKYFGTRACGMSGLIAFLEYCKLRDADIEILDYSNSGDTGLSKEKVVGYVSAIGLIKAKGDGKMKKFELTNSEKKRLLSIARQALTKEIAGKSEIDLKDIPAALETATGAFVTLTKNGQLRGCIGNIVSSEQLYLLVGDMAVAAALNDPRFPAVTSDELNGLEIEISVLTPIVEVLDISDIAVGTDGLIIRNGIHSGLLLPQVAVEYGWTRDEFLAHTCLKAGLSADEYKNQDTRIYKFSAIVFNEQDFTEQ